MIEIQQDIELSYNSKSIDSITYAYSILKSLDKNMIILITSEIFDNHLLKALSMI